MGLCRFQGWDSKKWLSTSSATSWERDDEIAFLLPEEAATNLTLAQVREIGFREGTPLSLPWPSRATPTLRQGSERNSRDAWLSGFAGLSDTELFDG